MHVFNAPIQVQSATNSVTIFGDPTIAGLAADTVFGFTVTTAIMLSDVMIW